MLRPLTILALAGLILTAACDPGLDNSTFSGDSAAVASRYGAPEVTVRPGESIQAALDQVQPGATVFITPGRYAEAIHIAKPGIRLVGLGRRVGSSGEGVPELVNPGDEEDGIVVTPGSDGVQIVNLAVRGFEENGILLVGVSNFLLSDIVAADNGEYGLFPVFSSHGRIERCVASGHSDTGIYVGQSEDVVITGNTAFGNVNGIEIENSSGVEASDNESYDNTAGVVAVLLPGLDVKTSAGLLIARNRVHDNNHVNFADGGFEQFVPQGSGVLVIGTDRTVVRDNEVTGNAFVGIAVANTGLIAQLAGVPIDVEPFPDGAEVRGNRVTGNGGAQPIPILPPGTDLLWDGTGTACFAGNTFTTSLDLDLPGGSPTPILPACP
jgi:parallel beta-helix repeat protein